MTGKQDKLVGDVTGSMLHGLNRYLDDNGLDASSVPAHVVFVAAVSIANMFAIAAKNEGMSLGQLRELQLLGEYLGNRNVVAMQRAAIERISNELDAPPDSVAVDKANAAIASIVEGLRNGKN